MTNFDYGFDDGFDYGFDDGFTQNNIINKIKGCTPAFAYLIIMSIMLIVGTTLTLIIRGKFSISQICSEISSIMCWTILLIFLCNYDMNLAWLLFSICFCSFCTSLIGRLASVIRRKKL